MVYTRGSIDHSSGGGVGLISRGYLTYSRCVVLVVLSHGCVEFYLTIEKIRKINKYIFSLNPNALKIKNPKSFEKTNIS